MTAMPMRALVRRPSSRLAEGIVTHAERVAVDADRAAFAEFLPVPEEAGAHVVLLGPDDDGVHRLLMADGAPRSAALFVELGYRPVAVDISEFEKLEGCVTCLSVRLR